MPEIVTEMETKLLQRGFQNTSFLLKIIHFATKIFHFSNKFPTNLDVLQICWKKVGQVYTVRVGKMLVKSCKNVGKLLLVYTLLKSLPRKWA